MAILYLMTVQFSKLRNFSTVDGAPVISSTLTTYTIRFSLITNSQKTVTSYINPSVMYGIIINVS
jgi:hypothetical protein